MKILSDPLEGYGFDQLAMCGRGHLYPRLLRPGIDLKGRPIEIGPVGIDRSRLPSREIPGDVKENLVWREETNARAAKDLAFRRKVLENCREDPLYFFNGFGWLYEPRSIDEKVIPLVTYGFQENLAKHMEAPFSMPSGDPRIWEKSRGMAATWTAMFVYVRRWLFFKNESFLLVSKKAESVDNKGDPDALFSKIDFIIERLPAWMMPPMGRNDRARMKLKNPVTNAIINGEARVAELARGGRRTGMFVDEAPLLPDIGDAISSIIDNTDCATFCGTPDKRGMTNPCVRYMTEEGFGRLTLHWPLHPDKSRGLYMADEDGTVRVFDKDWDHEGEGYEFIHDGKLRSPWYDLTESRIADPVRMAREHDISYTGATRAFFDNRSVAVSIEENAMEPTFVGDLDYEKETASPRGLVKNPFGRVRLWTPFDGFGHPIINGTVMAAADISSGSGASNSVLAVGIPEEREKIADIVTPELQPFEFSALCVAFLRFLSNPRNPQAANDPFLAWEMNGVGRQFGIRVLDLAYGNVYWEKGKDHPGVWMDTKTKKFLLDKLKEAYLTGNYINRSREAMEEAFEYVYMTSDKIEHVSALSKSDPSGAGQNHGDRVISDAILLHIMDEFGMSKERLASGGPPVGSLEWRIGEAKRVKERQEIELYGY